MNNSEVGTGNEVWMELDEEEEVLTLKIPMGMEGWFPAAIESLLKELRTQTEHMDDGDQRVAPILAPK